VKEWPKNEEEETIVGNSVKRIVRRGKTEKE